MSCYQRGPGVAHGHGCAPCLPRTCMRTDAICTVRYEVLRTEIHRLHRLHLTGGLVVLAEEHARATFGTGRGAAGVPGR